MEAPDPLSGHGCLLYVIGGILLFHGVLYALFYIASLF